MWVTFHIDIQAMKWADFSEVPIDHIQSYALMGLSIFFYD